MTPPIHIGAVIQNAHAFNIRNWQGTPQPMDNILQTVNDLFSLLKERQVSSVLVGGIAMLQYVQGRNTSSDHYYHPE